MERTKEEFKKQMSKIFIGGILLTMAFLIVGVGVVEKANAENESAIKVISPNGKEQWKKGETHNINWTSAGIEKVKITYLWNKADGSLFSQEIVSLNSNTGTYQWTIPETVDTRYNYRIQVSDGNKAIATELGKDYDLSNYYFSIVTSESSPELYIVITSPNGKEKLKIGEQHLIKWNTIGDIDQVSISLTKGNRHIKNLALNINNGNFSWVIDPILKFGIDYKIKITNPDDSSVYDESDNYFSITKSSEFTCLPDNTLIKLPDNPKIYIIIDCERHWIRTAEEFKRGGYKWENVKISTSDVINSFPEGFEFEDIKEGALIRTRGDIDIYIVKYIGNKRFIRLILNPSVFNSYGHLRWEDVIEVEEETMNSFVTSNLVRNAETGEIYRLTANGDNGTRRHFKSISVMQRLGYDLDAVYEINGTDRNSYEQGKDLE